LHEEEKKKTVVLDPTLLLIFRSVKIINNLNCFVAELLKE